MVKYVENIFKYYKMKFKYLKPFYLIFYKNTKILFFFLIINTR